MMSKRNSWLPNPSTWKDTWRDDWRITGQEGYLLSKKLQHRRFDRSLCRDDFDQCEFCYALFDKDPAHPLMAYFEAEGKYWVCPKCYADFKDYFCWEVEDVTDSKT